MLLDDRKGVRPGAMFADQELIGIPHRVAVGERGLDAGQYEYRSRRAPANDMKPIEGFVEWAAAAIRHESSLVDARQVFTALAGRTPSR